MKIIQAYIAKTDCFERILCRIMTGLICIFAISFLTACQSDAETRSEEGTGLNAATESMENNPEENSQTSSGYTYEELEDGTLRLTAYQPDTPLPEQKTLEVPAEIDGKKVTVIGAGCFSDDKAFAYESKVPEFIILLPEGITTIEDRVWNTHIKQVEIPDSVTEIMDEAFFVKDSDGSWEQSGRLLILSCSKDSVAEQYAKEHEIKYNYENEDFRKDEAFREEFEKPGATDLTWESGGYEYKYYGQYRVEGTHTDFCVVAYCSYATGFVYDIVALDKVSGEEVQRIPLVDMGTIQNEFYYEIVSEGDADFDGEAELLLYRGAFGMNYNTCYHCYDWKDTEGSYKEYADFRGITNPKINAEEQVIEGSIRDDGDGYTFSKYAFLDGEFVLVEDQKYRFVENEEGVREEVVYTYQYVNDEWILVNSEKTGVVKQ